VVVGEIVVVGVGSSSSPEHATTSNAMQIPMARRRRAAAEAVVGTSSR
jgi:hypothetical protein